MKPDRLFYGFEAQEVWDPHPPIDSESLLSWIARTTLGNHLPNITTILRDVGQRNHNKLADVIWHDIDVDGLATILGSDIGEVESRRGSDLGDGAMRYLEANVRAGDLHTATRRFAPATLRSDNEPYYRSAWLLRTFPVCSETWQILRSKCDCGVVQTWATVSTMVLCEGCGDDLRDLDSPIIPPEHQLGLKLLADILFGSSAERELAMSTLPDELRCLDPGEIHELALLMARISDPEIGNPREVVWRDDPLRLAMALSHAASHLHSWPETPFLALSNTCDVRSMKPRDSGPKALGRVLKLEYGTLPAALVNLVTQVRERIEIDGPTPPHGLVELNEAEKILRMNKKDVRLARAKGHISTRFVMRRAEILPGYDRSELNAIAATKGWPGSCVAGEEIGLPPYGVEQLCAMDELIWAKSPHRSLLTGLCVDPRSLKSFELTVRKSACEPSEITDAVRLVTVMRGTGGREKPWGPVLRALVEGRWPFAIEGAGRLVRNIVVERRDAEAIRALDFDRASWSMFDFTKRLAQVDACDILNVSMNNRADVERYRLPGSSANWHFDRQTVETLAASIVTSCELGARHFLQNRATAKALRGCVLTPRGFGYLRKDAHSEFEHAVQYCGRRRASSDLKGMGAKGFNTLKG